MMEMVCLWLNHQIFFQLHVTGWTTVKSFWLPLVQSFDYSATGNRIITI